MPPKILLIAGESSGDLHGSNLARAILRAEPGAELLGVGGPRMAAAGVRLLHDATKHAAVGIVEAVQHLGDFAALYRLLLSAVRREKPDVVVPIDFGDFNIRLCGWIRQEGVPIVYYISPQVWAWGRWRARKIARAVTKMLVIFPFEEPLYRALGVDVEWVGHPLLDAAPTRDGMERGALRKELGIPDDAFVVGLLPGSRTKEVRRLIGPIAGAAGMLAREIPGVRFLLAVADNVDPAACVGIPPGLPVTRVVGRSHEVLAASDFLLTKSGSSTVEAALFGVPMVMTYKVSYLTLAIFYPLVRVKRFGMVNLLAGRDVVPEVLQWRATPEGIAAAALDLIRTPGKLEAMKRGLAEVRAKLGTPGASDRAARAVLGVAGRTTNLQPPTSKKTPTPNPQP